MILLAVLFHNIQFVLFHLLAEVLPEVQNSYTCVKSILAHPKLVWLSCLTYNLNPSETE